MSARAIRSREAIASVLAVVMLATALLTESFAASASNPCGRAFLVAVRGGAPVCVHASEPAPPGVDLEHQPTLDELRALPFVVANEGPESIPAPADPEAAPAVAADSGIACVGDGQAGNRVQAIYARASNVTDRFAAVTDLIRKYAADADYRINVSARQSGTGRRIRFVHDANCTLSITRVTLSAAGAASFSGFVTDLEAKGFTRTDRKYLAWVDASVGICGVAELYPDDRAAQSNRNNKGPQYARVDAPCWGDAEAHELLHTLGAVQDSAPNSSNAGHCVDENDTMCYVDTSGHAMISTCRTAPSWQVDCGLNDYFNGAARSGNYLATHWDTANSTFLEPSNPLPQPPSIAVTAPSSIYAGVPYTISANTTVPAGRTSETTWSSSRSDCRFLRATGSPTTYYCRATAAGSGQAIGKVTDSLAMTSTYARTYRIVVPSRRRTTTARLSATATRVRPRARLTLIGRLTDASTRRQLIGMPIAVFARARGATAWKKIATRTTNASGAIALPIAPARTTAYVLVSGYTTTWDSDQSNTQTITVA
jgi:hypothetical protein